MVQVPYLFNNGHPGGFVLRPSAAGRSRLGDADSLINCMWANDAGTMGQVCAKGQSNQDCIGGCCDGAAQCAAGSTHWCPQPNGMSYCPWPPEKVRIHPLH